MKVFLCLHHFFPQVIGGTEMYTLNLASYLQSNGIEPVVVIPNFDKTNNQEYFYNGIRVICYSENSLEDRKIIMGKSKPDGLETFASLIKKEKPNVIHFHELAPGRGFNVYHVEKAKELNVPSLLTIHLSYYTCLKGSLIYNNEKKCDGKISIAKCTSCIFNEKKIEGARLKILETTAMLLYYLGVDMTSLNNRLTTALGFPFVIKNLKQTLVRLNNATERIIVLSKWYKTILEKNGVTSKNIKLIEQSIPALVSFTLSSQVTTLPLKVIYVGRVTQQKGIEVLIDAFSELEGSRAELSIYGPEADKDFAERCKKKTASRKNIYWKGTIPAGEVAKVLNEHDLLCQPSIFEMSPLIIQEAFAARIPVLASDIYGNAEYIKEGVNGWLFKFNSSADLNYKLKKLINNPKEIDSVKKKIPLPNSFDLLGKEHLELYAEVSQNKH